MYQVVSVCLKRTLCFMLHVRADAVKHGEDVQEYYKKLTTPEKDGDDILV